MAEYYDPETYPSEWNYLQPGTIIDQYVIERELAHGGFSSVYVARQTADQIQVAIKEYLPRKLAHRTWNNEVVVNNEETKNLFLRGRSLFFDEAKVLAKLKHPNIVEVINFFQANSTVYMVMVYEYGVMLDKLLKAKKITIDTEFMAGVFNDLINGVRAVHNNDFVHLDIKPGNILIRPGDEPLLLDFGAIHRPTYRESIKRSKILTKGFSPIEQYDRDGNIGPWTDIYAIGATMRSCLESAPPIPAPARKQNETMSPATKLFKKKFPGHMLKAIDWAMEIEPDNRPQSIDEFQQALQNN